MTYHTISLPGVQQKPFLQRLEVKSMLIRRVRVLGGIQAMTEMPKNRRHKTSAPRQAGQKHPPLTVKTKTNRPATPKYVSSVITGVKMA